MKLLYDLLLFLPSIYVVLAVPSWGGGYDVRPSASIGTLVPGASFLEAIEAGLSYEQYRPKYLSVSSASGVPGQAVIFENPSPPLFYINKDQLWQLTNETSILRVNIHNVTAEAQHPVPYKLALGEKPEGVKGGVWRWRGSMLHFDLGGKTNHGLYFSCTLKDGSRGVYMALEPMDSPEGCKFTTIHSFIRRHEK